MSPIFRKFQITNKSYLLFLFLFIWILFLLPLFDIKVVSTFWFTIIHNLKSQWKHISETTTNTTATTSSNNYKMPSSSLNKSNMAKCSKIASQLQRMGDDLNKRGNSSSSSNKSSGLGKSNKGGLSSKSSLSSSKPSGSLFTSRRFWLLKTIHHFSRRKNLNTW